MIKTEPKVIPLPFPSSSKPASTPGASSPIGAAAPTAAASGAAPTTPSKNAQLKAKVKSVVLSSWRQRLSPVKFSIELKKAFAAAEIPRGSSAAAPFPGDAVDLADIIIRQGFIGPAPNRLLLSYLEFCVGGAVVSFKSVLRRALVLADVSRPECLKALVSLADSFASSKSLTFADSIQFCVDNCVVLAETLDWTLDALNRLVTDDAVSGSESSVEAAEACASLLRRFLDDPALESLARVGFSASASSKSRAAANVESLRKANDANQSVVGRLSELLPALPGLWTQRAEPAGAALSTPLEGKALGLPVSALVSLEASLHPVVPADSFARRLASLTILSGASRERIFCEAVRAAFLGLVDAKEGEKAVEERRMGEGHRGASEETKWLTFMLLKLPEALRLTQRLTLVETASTSVEEDDDAAFKGILLCLTSTALVDLVDAKTGVDCAAALLRQLAAPRIGLLTEEQRRTLLLRRHGGNESAVVEALGKEAHPLVKAERTCEQIINTVSVGLAGNEDPLLGVLSHLSFGDGIKTVLSAAAATSRLSTLVSQLVSLNEQCRGGPEDHAASASVAVDRTLLYDLSFSALCYVRALFGRDAFSESIDAAANDPAHFIRWADDFFPCPSTAKNVEATTTTPDSLLQQLVSSNGVTLTAPSPSRLSDLVDATPFAVRELLTAWESGAVGVDLVMSCLEKLKAFSCLPITAACWLIGFAASLPDERREKPVFMVQQLLSFGATPPGNLLKDYSKFYSERTRIAHQVLTLLHRELVAPHVADFDPVSSTAPSKGEAASKGAAIVSTPGTNANVMRAVFADCLDRGWLSIRGAHQLARLLEVSGARWFSAGVARILLEQFYQNDLNATANLLAAWFRLSQEDLTAALVGVAMPEILDAASPSGGAPASSSAGVQNPHARALARLSVACLVDAFSDRDSLPSSAPRKRPSFSSALPPPRKRLRLESADQRNLRSFLASDDSPFSDEVDSAAAAAAAAAETLDVKPDIKPDIKPDVKQEAKPDPAKEMADPMTSALTALFDSFVRVLDGGTIDSRLLFVLSFLEEAARSGQARRILAPAPLRLSAKLLAAAPKEMSTQKLMAMGDLASEAGRAAAAVLLHVYGGAL